MKFRFIKIMVYGIIIAALAAGSFFACQMEEFAGVRAPARQKDNGPPVPKTPYLDTLSLDNGLTLAPIFTPNVISYTVNLPNPPPETVTITATAAAGLGIDYPTGQTVAPSPESPAQIVVTNEVGMSTAYLLVFDPGDLPSARLLDIKLSQGQIADFDPDEFVYSVELPYETGEVAIVPIPEIAGSLFNYNPASTIDMTDGEARSVTIGVVAPNHSLGEYRIDFTVGAAQASRLANVSLSAGSLDQPFAAEILAYTINIYEGIHPLVVDAIRISTADTVRFLETSTSTVLAESPAKAFTEADLNGLQFTITVHQGIGYTPTDYTFTISTSPMLPAKLSSIVFANGGAPVGTLYRGLPGEQAGTAFDSDITAYTLEFTHEAIATMTVSGQGGAKALISPNIIGNTITVDYNPLQASMLLAGSSTPVRKFVTITAHEDAHIDTTYTVYFKKTPLPRATLDKLEVFGGTLVHTVDGPAVTDADVQNAASFDAQNKKQYTVTAMANTQAVIVEGTPKAATNIGVTYQPKNFLSGLTVGADSIISVDVSDGDLDYAATTYELTVHVLEAQNPRLIAPLTVNSESITLDDSRLVYAHTIPYAGYANGGSPFVAWSPNGCVTEVTYSFNLGAQWFDDTEKDGFTAAEAAAKQFVVNYSETKHILVKLRAVDGTEAVYTLIITQEGNPSANLTDIKVYDVETGGIAITIKQRIDQTPGFLPTVYAYDVRIGADTAFIEPLGPPPGASITYSIVGGSSGSYTPGGARIPVSNLSIDTAQVVEISVHPQGGGAPNTYTLYIQQQANDEALLLNVTPPAGTTTSGSITLGPSGTFQSGTFNYTVTLPYDYSGSVTFTPLQISDGAKLYYAITAPGTTPNFGSNEITSQLGVSINVLDVTINTPKTISFLVQAQNMVHTNTYSFYITQLRNNEAQITALYTDLPLTVGGAAQVFAANIYAYSSEVSTSGSITIQPTAISAGASMTYRIITNNTTVTQPAPLTTGTAIPSLSAPAANETTTVVITVVSQDGTAINSYSFAITRPGSSAAQILALTAANGELQNNGAVTPFSATIFNYTVVVPYNQTTADITPTRISAGAAISAKIDDEQQSPISAAPDGTLSDSNTIPVTIGAGGASTPKLLTLTVTPQSGAAAGIYTFYVTHTPSVATNVPVTFNVEQAASIGNFRDYTPEPNSGSTSHTITPAYMYTRVKITPTFTPGTTGAVLKYRANGETNFMLADTSVGHIIDGLEVHTPKTAVFQVFAEAGNPGQMYTFTIIRQPNTDGSLSVHNVPSVGTGTGSGSPTGALAVTLDDSNTTSINNITDNITIRFNVPEGAVLYYINGTSMTPASNYETINSIPTATIAGLMVGSDILNKTFSFMVQPQDTTAAPHLYEVIVKRKYDKTFDYTGAPITWTTLFTCKYQIICVGAQGGTGINATDTTSNGSGGFGGWSQGNKNLQQNDGLFLYIGEAGKSNGTSSWNGGGHGSTGGRGTGGGGGGATDIRKGGQNLSNRIIVAGGGGGGAIRRDLGAYGGGGEFGSAQECPSSEGQANAAAPDYNLSARWAGDNPSSSNPPTAIGFQDGIGQNANNTLTAGAGGGGGYKGGWANTEQSNPFPGGGGSGYINSAEFIAGTLAGGGPSSKPGNGYITITLILPTNP